MPENTDTDKATEQTESSETESSEQTEETFSATYVAELRQEAAEHRTRAQRSDELAQRLHTSLVAATGRLADPSDLPYDEAHLDGEDELSNALDSLLARKPHLASRRPSGDVGQGASGGSGDVDLAGMLRGLAG